MDSIYTFTAKAPQAICGRTASAMNHKVNTLSFGENVYFEKDDRRAKVSSLLGLLSLGLGANEDFLVVICDGSKEQADILLKIISGRG